MDQKIEHFSHIHPLFLLKEHHKKDGVQALCSGCEKPISSDPAFGCSKCYYILHKPCAELPHKVKHPLHPQHPLTLLSTPPYSAGYICDACRAIYYNSFLYHCSLCSYDLDIACASTWHPDDGHSHAFISLNNSNPFVCYACGVEGSEGLACLCSICQIWVHSSCSELPQTIRIKCHNHPLSLTYSLHHVFGFRDDLTCGACDGTMSSTFGGYFCSACEFVIHLECGEQQTEDSGVETEDETRVSDSYMESSSSVGSEIDQDQTSLDIGFSLFSHEHLLTFMDELSLQCSDKLCDGCVQPINPPLFSCSQEGCGFLLHQSCAELPRTKQHRFHHHPLTLLPKAPPYDGIYRCDGCKLLGNGFVYRCGECQFDLDVLCGNLVGRVKHESHEHPLVLEKTSIARECKCCHVVSKHVLVCEVCEDFAIDVGCAALPSKAWHMCDKHPLRLIYFVEENLREQHYNCGICKEKMATNQWFYYCDDCDFCAHPYCILNKSCRGVKFRGTFEYDVHSHPLALVDEKREHPKCEACGEGCSGWTLECGQCKCYFHREGQCFWEQFKKSAKYLALSGTMRHKYAANVVAATPNVTNK